MKSSWRRWVFLNVCALLWTSFACGGEPPGPRPEAPHHYVLTKNGRLTAVEVLGVPADYAPVSWPDALREVGVGKTLYTLSENTPFRPLPYWIRWPDDGVTRQVRGGKIEAAEDAEVRDPDQWELQDEKYPWTVRTDLSLDFAGDALLFMYAYAEAFVGWLVRNGWDEEMARGIYRLPMSVHLIQSPELYARATDRKSRGGGLTHVGYFEEKVVVARIYAWAAQDGPLNFRYTYRNRDSFQHELTHAFLQFVFSSSVRGSSLPVGMEEGLCYSLEPWNFMVDPEPGPRAPSHLRQTINGLKFDTYMAGGQWPPDWNMALLHVGATGFFPNREDRSSEALLSLTDTLPCQAFVTFMLGEPARQEELMAALRRSWEGKPLFSPDRWTALSEAWLPYWNERVAEATAWEFAGHEELAVEFTEELAGFMAAAMRLDYAREEPLGAAEMMRERLNITPLALNVITLIDNKYGADTSWDRLPAQRLALEAYENGRPVRVLPYRPWRRGESGAPFAREFMDNDVVRRVALSRGVMTTLRRLNRAATVPGEAEAYAGAWRSGNPGILAEFLSQHPPWRQSPGLYDYAPTCREVSGALKTLAEQGQASLCLLDVEMLLPFPGNVMEHLIPDTMALLPKNPVVE